VKQIISQNSAEQKADDQERLLVAAEVAALFRVDVRTVGQWARARRLVSVRTPGGHRRYPENAVRALLAWQIGGQK
jgi:excisionase family DNA binding protein